MITLQRKLEIWLWAKFTRRLLRQGRLIVKNAPGTPDAITPTGVLFDFKTVRPRGEPLRGRYQR